MSSDVTRDFFEIAGQQGMLPHDTLRDLHLESTSRQIPGPSLVLQKGLLTALDVDIIETLRQPSGAIPGYEIQSVLGRGGMGVVYRARQVALDRMVALKMVLVSHTANPTMLTRFEQEAHTVGRLLHPHIITAYDFGRHEGRLYFAMEFVEGKDAEKFVGQHHPLTEFQVWQLIRQAASGLSHAAELGIVHRDIKPANLLLVSPPRGYPLPPDIPMVKIADFGLAFLSAEIDEKTRLTSEQSTLGSPHYMAPEQLNAGNIVDQRADIYSLGATAFHLLTGKPPFDGGTVLRIIAQKLKDEPPSVADLRQGLSDGTIRLIRSMMARDLDQRVGTYAELVDQIDALPVMSSVTTPTTRFSTPGAATVVIPRRRASWVWITAAIALLVAVPIVLFAILPMFSKPRTVAQPQAVALKETGWSMELFDGKSLKGWRIQSGTWTVDADDEKSAIIGGTSGEILRPLMKPAGDRAERLTCYRLTYTTRLHEATAVELHFNVSRTGSRDVLRITRDSLAIGRRAASRAPFEQAGEPKPFDAGTDKLHEIRLVRDLSFWRLYVEETAAGVVPIGETLELPEFHLAVEGGPAWFGDLFVEELAAP